MAEDDRLRNAGFVPANELKFYLYQSRAKIDQLYRQIQAPKKKTTVEWKVDAKIGSFMRKTERENEPNDEDKLRAVLRELESLQLLGALEDQKPYIKCIFPMRWGIYNDSSCRPDNEGPLVYFSGMSDARLVGMGGSSCHIVGCYGLTSTASRSCTPALVHFLRTGLDTGEGPEPIWHESEREQLDETYEAMLIANYYLRGPVQNLDFVAKVLCRETISGAGRWADGYNGHIDAILATPLYVAQVDPMAEDG